jgi:hypothetical protein
VFSCLNVTFSAEFLGLGVLKSVTCYSAVIQIIWDQKGKCIKPEFNIHMSVRRNNILL